MWAIPFFPCLTDYLSSAKMAVEYSYITKHIKLYPEIVGFAIGRISEQGLEIIVAWQPVPEIILRRNGCVDKSVIVKVDEVF